MREIRVATSNPLKALAVARESPGARVRMIGVPGRGVPRGPASVVKGAVARARRVRGVGFEAGFVGRYMVCACALADGRVGFGPAFLLPRGARLGRRGGVVAVATRGAKSRLDVLRSAYRSAKMAPRCVG